MQHQGTRTGRTHSVPAGVTPWYQVTNGAVVTKRGICHYSRPLNTEVITWQDAHIIRDHILSLYGIKCLCYIAGRDGDIVYSWILSTDILPEPTTMLLRGFISGFIAAHTKEETK